MSLRASVLLATFACLTACADSAPTEAVVDDPAAPSLSEGGSPVTLHPVAYGNWISAREYGCAGGLGKWDCVNDQPGNAAAGDPAPDDGDATMLTTTSSKRWTPKLSVSLDETQLPPGFTVTEITVFARAAAHRPRSRRTSAIRLFLRMHPVQGPDVPCSAGAVNVTETAYITVSCTFSGSDLGALPPNSLPEIGFEETGGGEIKVTQMYAVVGW